MDKYHEIIVDDILFFRIVRIMGHQIKKLWYYFSNKTIYEHCKKYDETIREIYKIAKQCGKNTNGTLNHDNIPKISYKYGDTILHLKIDFIALKKKQQYYDLIEIIGIKTHSFNISTSFNKQCYTDIGLIKDNFPIRQFVSDNDPLAIPVATCFGTLVKWQINKYPHLLVVGTTGSGKTTFIYYLLSSLLRYYKVDLVDGKSLDFISLSGKLNKYADATTPSAVYRIILEFDKEMLERVDKLKAKGMRNIYEDGCTYKPRFLLVEELSSIVEGITDKKTKEEVVIAFNRISRLGRAIGMNLIASLQRPDTKYISGDSRNNFNCKIVLGTNDNETYRMMYGDGTKLEEELDTGKGYCRMGGKLYPISTPNVEELDLTS